MNALFCLRSDDFTSEFGGNHVSCVNLIHNSYKNKGWQPAGQLRFEESVDIIPAAVKQSYQAGGHFECNFGGGKLIQFDDDYIQLSSQFFRQR